MTKTKFRHRTVFMFLVCMFFVAGTGLSAITVKIGSPFPEGSPWDLSLRNMAEEWRRITEGEVRVRIYPGGIAGDDGDMVRKMRFGQLDAAILTSIGAKTLVPNSFVMSLPGLLQSEDELDMMLSDFAPRFEKDFLEQRFRVLSWSHAGWAYIFTNELVTEIQDLKRMTLATNSSDKEVTTQFKALKFNVVPTTFSDLIVALQSGMVDAYYASPVISAAFQWFALAPNMVNLPIAPVLGCFLVTSKTWDRIPSKYHEDLLKYVDTMTRESIESSMESNREALKVMKENKLSVVELNNTQQTEWYKAFESGIPLVVGNDKWIDTSVYNAAVSQIEQYRSRQ